MSRMVDRGFCEDRCNERGACLETDKGYSCLCYEPSSDVNCGGGMTSSTTYSCSEEYPTKLIAFVGALIFIVALIGLVAVLFVAWHRARYVRRVPAIEEKKDVKKEMVPTAPVEVTDV
ncbi:EGF-like domain protein [Ancylostoma caninum]|uniref:EGF-like domain protein n=1 Tax=Ancylostoma caninum TaxID=29170 RepID=A0A368F588_ANCCA|nr:EGF-like domain protein [Ancylostoma caninum]